MKFLSAGRGMKRGRTLAFLALLAGGCAIGFAPIFVRWSDVGPVASAFWRQALAAPLLWLWVGATRRGGADVSVFRSRAAWLAGLIFGADLGIWHSSIMYTSVTNATFLGNLAPIFVALGSWVLFRQRASGLLLVAMVTALSGAALLMGPNLNVGGTRLLGDGLGVLTAVSYGSYMLAIKRARETESTAALMALSTIVSTGVLLPAAMLSPQPMWPAGAQGWAVLTGLALITQILGQGLITYGFAHLSATLSSVSLLIQPVVSAALARWLFAEALLWPQLIGGALVLGGIFIAKRSE